MPPRITATRQHVFCAGHRVAGHEGKCAHPHGHNYRVRFTCEAPHRGLDPLGRVIDFAEIKARLCGWIETNWDHKFLVFREDTALLEALRKLDPDGLVPLPFNPTAENIAAHLLTVVGPRELTGTGIALVSVLVEETPNCAAEARIAPGEDRP